MNEVILTRRQSVTLFFSALLLVLAPAQFAFADDTGKAWDEHPVVDVDAFKVLFSTADDPMFRHPVMPIETEVQGDYEQWKQWPIMRMSKGEILKLIPQQVGLLHLGCPECNGGAENAQNDFNDKAQLPRQWSYWQWDYKKPEVYSCKKCGESFPENRKYPMDKVDVFHNRLGEKIERRYWLDPSKDKNGFKQRFDKYYLDSVVDHYKMHWVGKNLQNLGDAYLLSGDEAFAYKAAILMNAMSEVFPHWLYMMNYAHGYLDYEPGMRWRSTYTRTNHRRSENWSGPIGMGRAYDVFFNSTAWQQYSKESGVDLWAKYLTYVCKFIKPGMFAKGRLPDKGLDEWQQGCPGVREIRTGLLLHDPRFMRRFADHMERIPFVTYGSDGGYFEGSGYTALQLNPMMRMRDMNGYSDPAGFKPPRGESLIKDWWYPAGHYEDFHRKAYNIQREIALPDGGGVVYNDAGGSFPSASYLSRQRKPRSFNVMKHGLKHVVLGDGTGEDQFQAHMLFGLDSKHGHNDTMSLQIYAKGHYMVDDITYPKHRMRGTYGHAFLHNTGLIDGRSHAKGPVGDGKPEYYEPRFNGLAAVRIDGENMYPGHDDGVFERTLVTVTIDPENPYVVDLFRMNGGRQMREYMLQGSYRHRATAEVSVPTKTLPGLRPLMRPGAKWDDAGKDTVKHDDKYGLFTNVRELPKNKDFKLTYTLKNTWREAGDDDKDGQAKGEPKDLYLDPDKPAVGLVNHFIGMPGATPYLTDIPRRVSDVGSTAKMEQMPQLVYRDEAMGAESQFVCVHEPFKGKPVIKQVRRLDTAADTLALVVTFLDGREDLLLLSTDEKPLSYEANGVKTDAKLAVISRPASGEPAAWMVGGTYLEAEGVSLKKEAASFNGRIVRSLRKWDGDAFDGFEIASANGDNATLPAAGDELVGAWVTLRNDGALDSLDARLISTSMEDWYDKYHSRDNSQIEEEKKKNLDSPGVLAWEADQRRYEQSKQAGVGWAFEIKAVVRKDGRLYLVTEDDHGLSIDGKKQTARELFFPNRLLNDGETTWRIETAASTLPMKRMTPKQIVARPDELASVKQNLMPYPQEGNAFYRYINPDDPRDVRAELVIDATHLGSDKPSDAKPGLVHFLGRRSYANGEVVDATYEGYASVSEGEMRKYIFKPEGGRQHFAGYLKVPADGVYTFYLRAGGNGELIVGNQLVSPELPTLGAPYPRIIRLKLKAGHIPFEFWASMQGSKYWDASNEIGWEGPGLDRRAMVFDDFVYSQADLDAIKQRVVVNQLGGESARYDGIRKHVLAASSYGGGAVYLNGRRIGELKGGDIWTHSINLKKGDVLVLKAKPHKDRQGASLSALQKGEPLFGSKDCVWTTTEPGQIFFTTAAADASMGHAKTGVARSNESKDRSIKVYGGAFVWPKDADAVWLKHVVVLP